MTFQSPAMQYIVATGRMRELQRAAERERLGREARSGRQRQTAEAPRPLVVARTPADASVR